MPEQDAINAHLGFMLYDVQEADISNEAIKRAQMSIVVADRSKFGTCAPTNIQSPQSIDLLVTNAQPDGPISARLAQHDISLDVI